MISNFLWRCAELLLALFGEPGIWIALVFLIGVFIGIYCDVRQW